MELNKMNITKEEIEKMSYTEFVGFINQWNVLPGAHDTLTKWEMFSKLNDKSNMLEIACTTGFSSRELALSTNCQGKAFDICESSVKSAIENKEKYASKIKIDYFKEDGYNFKSDEKFSHIVIGASLKFFPNPQKMLNKCISLLKDNGFILASPFYIKSPIPNSLVEEFQQVFGIKPTTESYKDIMNMYKGLEIIYHEKNDILQETEEELKHYCHSTITRACELRSISDKKIYDIMYKRLYAVKQMSNKLRPYQGYVVLVL